MFGWLSKLFASRVSPGDVATLDKACQMLYLELEEMKKQLNRVERKVYRDNGKSADSEQLAEVFGTTAKPTGINWDSFKAGDQIPPDITL